MAEFKNSIGDANGNRNVLEKLKSNLPSNEERLASVLAKDSDSEGMTDAGEVSDIDVSEKKLEVQNVKKFDAQREAFQKILSGKGIKSGDEFVLQERKDDPKRDNVYKINESGEPVFSGSISKPRNKREAKSEKKKKERREYTEEEIGKIEQARTAANYTLNKAENNVEFNAKTEKDGDEVFKKKVRELWKEFAVHGHVTFDENGEIIFKEETDLDGKGFLKMMQLAGIDVSDLKYLRHGEMREGGVTGDTGGKEGVVLEEKNSLIFDHHGENSNQKNSATKLAYETLTELGLLKDEDGTLKKFSDFVTEQDNGIYYDTELKKLFDSKEKKFAKTISGLERYLDVDTIFELLKEVKDHKTALSDEILKETRINYLGDEEKTLKEISGKIERMMDQSKSAIRSMKKQGFAIDSGKERFGKILIDTGNLKIDKENGESKYLNKVSLGFEAVRAAGFGAYIIWIPEQKRFKVFTKKPMRDISFSQGEMIHGDKYWTKRGTDALELEVTLEEILGKLCGKEKMEIPENLESAIKKEQEKRKELNMEKTETEKEIEFSEKEERFITEVYVEFARDYQTEIENHFSENNGYKTEDIPEGIRIEMERFWQRVISKEIEKDGDISKEKIEFAVEKIKEIVKKSK